MGNKNGYANRKTWKTSLLWFGLLAFFLYSYQAVLDFESITDPRRLEALARMLRALSQPNLLDSELVRDVRDQMWETFQIAFLAIAISAVLATPFAFFSVWVSSPWGRGVNFLVQLLGAAIRSIHPLLIVIPIVVVVGLGPTAGVLALTLFSTAVLTANFSEYAQQHPEIPRIDLLKSHFPGLAFRYFSTVLLMASVIGFMGGGGIGFLIQQHFSLLNYADASVALLACIITIGGSDLLSRAVWRKLQAASESEKEAILSRI